MKKFLLSAALVSLALSAYADSTVLFSDDFEWLKPFITAYDAANPNKPVGNTIAENNNDANCPNLTQKNADGTTVYDAAVALGYEFPVTHSDKDKSGAEVKAREPAKQNYFNNCYLKFGLTNYFSGLTFPTLNTEETVTNGEISFDWCTMRQGSGKWDTTQLVVVVENGDNAKQFLVEPLNIADNADFKWYPTTVSLTGATLTKGTKITIRPIDAQWPGQASKEAGNLTYRWFLDNVKISAATSTGGAAVEEINADENAPVEYYNLQGVRVANPENGLYIVKQGNKVAKRIIK